MINIMIVDDDVLVRASIQAFTNWEERGFSFCYEASDGLEALQILKKNPYIDLILLDIFMPRMGGLEFLKILKEQETKPQVIVLSANDHYKSVRQAFQLGALDYILKSHIDEKNLLSLLLKFKKSIEKKESKTDFNQKDIEYMSQKLVLDLLEGRHLDITYPLLKDCDLDFPLPMRLCLMRVIERANWYDSLQNLIYIQGRQYLNKRAQGWLCPLEQGELIFGLCVKRSKEESYFEAQSFANGFIEVIKNSTGFSLDLSLSLPCNGYKDFKEQFSYVKSLQSNESRLVHHAKQYIGKNFQDSSLSLDQVSRYVEVSKTHFSTQFKKETGKTFREYLTFLRVQKAQQLLLETNLKVYEVSEAVGYLNVEHFSRVFKRETDQTPNKFFKEN